MFFWFKCNEVKTLWPKKFSPAKIMSIASKALKKGKYKVVRKNKLERIYKSIQWKMRLNNEGEIVTFHPIIGK